MSLYLEEYRKLMESTKIHKKDFIPKETATDSEINTTENLQVLLMKTLQHQVEDREFHAQLRTSLYYLTTVLEQFCSVQLHYIPYTPNEKISKFTITVSQNSLVQGKPGRRSQYPIVLNNKCLEETSVVYRKSLTSKFSDSSLSEIFPVGRFHSNSILCKVSYDKAIQSNLDTPILRQSKLIQTQFISLGSFDVNQFKISLIANLRNLKQNVITLRELLFSVENYHSGGICPLKSLDDYDRLRMRNEDEYKFLQAKVRATNFVRFYKMRNVDNTKKRRGIRKRNT